MNSPSAGDQLAVKPGGLLIAAVGFGLTRLILAEAVYAGGMGMSITTVGRVLPLALGLGTALYGVNLAVSTRSRRYARTVAGWFLAGTVALAATAAMSLSAAPDGGTVDGTTVASVMLVGGVGGVVVGIKSAEAARSRESIRRQSERATVLNRIVRHEIRNALTAVRGHADLLLDGEQADAERSRTAVRDGLDRIERAVAETGFLVDDAAEADGRLGPVRVDDALRTRLDDRPGTGPRVSPDLPSVSVRADGDLGRLFGELLALSERGDPAAEPAVDVTVAEHTVTVAVSAPGAWLTERERSVLVDGIPEYERNDVDHAVPVVRLLATGYGGRIAVEGGDGETAVRVELPRTGEGAPPGDSPGIPSATLWGTFGVGTVAGVAMGATLQATTGSIPVIGALYGTAATEVGWVAHLFHSAVFATTFVAGVSKSALADRAGSVPGAVALGVGYGAVLWLLAAGVVMSLWLNATGVDAPLPNLTAASLVGHVVWGAVVGASYPAIAGGPPAVATAAVGRLRAAVGDRLGFG